MSMKNPNDTIWNRTSDLPICSIAPYPLCYSFSVTNWNSEALRSGTSVSAVFISVCLTSLTPCIFNIWEKKLPHLAKILWESATISPLSSFTTLVLSWLPFLKSLMPLYKSLIFFILLLVSSSSIYSFQICLLFVPEMSAGITSYMVQIIYIAFAWVMYPLHFSMLPLI